MGKYQVMPPLTDQEYQELKESILKHGVQVAVDYDEDGNILDGHHRVQACSELGITNIPKVVKVGMDENQKLDYALMVNSTRRQLSREQKQELIRQQLKRTPEKSDRQIAGLIGTSNSTVSEARKEMVNTGQLCESHTSTGIDGKSYPRQTKPVTLYAPTENTIAATKELMQTASPALVNAVAEGKVPVMQAYAVADQSTHTEQAEALNRLEFGKAKHLMDGINQQAAEHAFDLTPDQREESEERLRKANAEVDRQFDIKKDIDKAIFSASNLPTSHLDDDIRIYMNIDPNFDLEIILMDINMGINNLMLLQKSFRDTKKLKVVK